MRLLPMRPQNPDGAGKFLEISEAHSILSDPIKRRRYDAGGYEEQQQGYR